ncbi:MAG: hypothetical protein R2706_10725 [Acidimicrobiales bacterium]
MYAGTSTEIRGAASSEFISRRHNLMAVTLANPPKFHNRTQDHHQLQQANDDHPGRRD